MSCKFVSGFSCNSSNYVAFFSSACKNVFLSTFTKHQREGFACVVDLNGLLLSIFVHSCRSKSPIASKLSCC